jgi:hypothetical protein
MKTRREAHQQLTLHTLTRNQGQALLNVRLLCLRRTQLISPRQRRKEEPAQRLRDEGPKELPVIEKARDREDEN